MNNIQRAGAFITVALVVAIVVLHGPWEGYTTTIYSEGLGRSIPASFIELSFLDWRSNAPVILWFGSILHVVVALFFVGLLSAAWHYLFRSSQGTANELQNSSKRN